MRSRYLEIALTYTRPLLLRIWAVVAAVTLLCMPVAVLFARLDYGGQAAILLTGGTLTVWIAAMITAHAKEQLADPRASLTPRFRTPHLVVAAVMFLIFVVGFALLIAMLPYERAWLDIPPWEKQAPPPDDVSPVGYLALVLTMAAVMAWMSHMQTPTGVVFVMLMVSPVMFASGRAMLDDIVHGRAVAVASIILAAALAALAALWARMALLHAEMPEYSRTMGPGFRLRVQMTGDVGFRRENAAGAGAIEGWVRRADRLDTIANVAAAGFWQRVRHWQIVIGLGRTAIVVALLLGLWAFVTPLIVGGGRDKGARVIVPVALSVLVPGLIVAAIWPRRWFTLAEESLRPASRRQFVREQGAAMALEMTMTWLWLTLALFGGALLVEPSTYGLSPLWRALPVIVAAQVLNFSVIVWVMRYRSGWLIVVPIFLAMFTGLGVLVIGGILAELHSIQPMLLAAAVIAAVGLAIALDAYRRWLTTEFD